MSSQPSLNYTFRTRVDDFAKFVSCDQDHKFWFRLEALENTDNITDFFLGAFDPELGGELLVACYRKLDLQPQARIVFGDILSSRDGDPAKVENATNRLLNYSEHLLTNFGRRIRGTRIESRRNKFDLVIET
jgi:hypothetical protein